LRLHIVRENLQYAPPPHLPSLSCSATALALTKTWGLFGNTRYLCGYKPLAPLEPAEPAAARKKGGMAWHCLQRAVWHNGGCASLDNVTKQQVKWFVASAGSPPLRQAATTLATISGDSAVGIGRKQIKNRNVKEYITMTKRISLLSTV
jgi:hypothetical protein